MISNQETAQNNANTDEEAAAIVVPDLKGNFIRDGALILVPGDEFTGPWLDKELAKMTHVGNWR